jgi:hypothetical protein
MAPSCPAIGKFALEYGYAAAQKALEGDITADLRLAASGCGISGAGGLMDGNPDFRSIGVLIFSPAR